MEFSVYYLDVKNSNTRIYKYKYIAVLEIQSQFKQTLSSWFKFILNIFRNTILFFLSILMFCYTEWSPYSYFSATKNLALSDFKVLDVSVFYTIPEKNNSQSRDTSSCKEKGGGP